MNSTIRTLCALRDCPWPLSAAEVAERGGMSASTAHRCLRWLTDAYLVRQVGVTRTGAKTYWHC